MLYFICYFKNQLLLLTFQCTLGAFCTTCHIVIFFKYDHKGLRNTSCMDLPFKFFLFVLNSGLCETLIDTKKFIHISCALAHINMIYIIWFYIKKKVWKIKQVLIWYSSYLPRHYFFYTKTNGSLLRLWYYWYTEATSHKNYWKRA